MRFATTVADKSQSVVNVATRHQRGANSATIRVMARVTQAALHRVGAWKAQAPEGSTLNGNDVSTALVRASIEARKRHTNSKVTSNRPG